MTPSLPRSARALLLALLCAASVLRGARAALELAQVFGDGCVLQASDEGGARAAVFGYTAAGNAVSVELRDAATQKPLGAPVKATAGADGAFSVALDALSGALPPFDVRVADLATGELFVAPCIEALIATEAPYIIWCPGYMKAVGRKSASPVAISTSAFPGSVKSMDFVSYEDAANVIVRAVEVADFDNKHITALTAAGGAEL